MIKEVLKISNQTSGVVRVRVTRKNDSEVCLLNSSSTTFCAPFKHTSIQSDRPCAIHRRRVSQKLTKVLLLPQRDPSTFLSEIPDTVPLSSLMLPGTHDTMAFYGWPISQCQNSYETLEKQFKSGIRVIDVRLSIKNGELMSYHGIISQHARFSMMLNVIHAFLMNPSTCRETIVVSIKQEDENPTLFSQLVLQEIMNAPGGLHMWYLDDRIPTLGEVRGKAVMLSRFGNGTGWADGLMGIHPPIWPDSDKDGFTWNCGDTLVRTQDWYNITSLYSIPEKVKQCTDLLYPPLDTPSPALSIVFFSASSFPLALPPSVARGLGWPRWHLGFEGVNHRVGDWLLGLLGGEDEGEGEGEDALTVADLDNEKTAEFMENQPRVRGWAMVDFFDEPVNPGLIQLFIECNFRGRKSGEEGWP